MTVFRLGSTGGEVASIQTRLQTLGHYRGLLDGYFGGATETAVKRFQAERRLALDGVVGSVTWQALFGESIPAAILASQSLAYRCLALAGAFETDSGIPECFAGLSGDFDGQGLSLGVLQWNFGQGSLQPLLLEMARRHGVLFRELFRPDDAMLLETLSGDRNAQLDFARSIQHPVKHQIYEPWRGRFKALCRTAEFQAIQTRAAEALHQSARRLAGEYGLASQRGIALMFDIKVQNGSISAPTRQQILADFEQLATELPAALREVARMKIIAQRRADAANPRWVEDVRARKLCIALGEGTVHGISYNLAEQFAITLEPA